MAAWFVVVFSVTVLLRMVSRPPCTTIVEALPGLVNCTPSRMRGGAAAGGLALEGAGPGPENRFGGKERAHPKIENLRERILAGVARHDEPAGRVERRAGGGVVVVEEIAGVGKVRRDLAAEAEID